MREADWTAVDEYFERALGLSDPALDAALAASAQAGLPAISVTPAQGKFLYLLAKIRGAKRILEIGTLGGYSTIWLARALPADGALISLEVSARHAAVARANIEGAGLAARVDIRVGPALERLQALAEQRQAPFDLVFIDADKRNNANYLEFALRMTQPGSVIVCDNVVRQGRVADLRQSDPDVLGVQDFIDRAHADPRLETTALQTVGAKGWDGFALCRVTG